MTPTQATTVSQHLHIEVEPEKAVDGKEDYQAESRVAQLLVAVELNGEVDGQGDDGVEEEEEEEDVALHQREVWLKLLLSFFFFNSRVDRALTFT